MNVVALEDLGLAPDRCSGLCTAASMDNVSIRSMTYRGLTVTAIATAGIEHNGGRAGDPATYYEENGGFHGLPEDNPGDDPEPMPGTINIILHINADLDSGTLARTIITATEAKTAVLQELMVRSHNSSGLATGSGTDGIISICNPGSPLKLTNAGKNSKLGELIGKTVKAAVGDALFRQSGLCPDKQRDALRIMERYGIDEDRLWNAYQHSCFIKAESAEFDTDKFGNTVNSARGSTIINSNTTSNTAKGLKKADFIDRLDHLKGTSKLLQTTFLYTHVLDLLAWELINPEEAEHMTSELLDGISLPETGCSGQEALVDKYIRYLILLLDERPLSCPSGPVGNAGGPEHKWQTQ